MRYASYALTALPFILAIALGLLIPILVVAMLQRPATGVVLFALAVLQTMLLPGLALPVGITLFFADIVTAALFVAATVRRAETSFSCTSSDTASGCTLRPPSERAACRMSSSLACTLI